VEGAINTPPLTTPKNKGIGTNSGSGEAAKGYIIHGIVGKWTEGRIGNDQCC